MIAWLVPTWSVVWSCALGSFAVLVMSRVGRSIGVTLVRMTDQTRISSRYQMHCRLGLQFSCQTWKSCIGCLLPRLALGFGGVVWLHCSCGLSAEQVGSPARWLTEGTVNLLVVPTVLAWSKRCELTGNVVMWAGVVALFAIPAMTYSSWALTGSNRYPWVIAWLVSAWSVDLSCALGGLAVPVVFSSWVEHWRGYCRDDGSDWDSSRYLTHCTLCLKKTSLTFSTVTWKTIIGFW